MHPETKHGASNALNSIKDRNKNADSAFLFEAIEDTKSFVDDMGEKTNQSSRTISEVIARVPVLKLEQ